MKILRTDDYAALLFAAIIGAVVAGHDFLYNIDHGEPFIKTVLNSLLIAIAFAGFIFGAYMSGGRKVSENGDIEVSPWFGFFIGGSFFLFWMGGIYANNLYYGGMAAVAIWSSLLLCVWGIKRIIDQRRAKLLTKGSDKSPSDRIWDHTNPNERKR